MKHCVKICILVLLLANIFVSHCKADNVQYDIFRDPIRLPLRLRNPQASSSVGNNPQQQQQTIDALENVPGSPINSPIPLPAPIASATAPVVATNQGYDPVDVRISDVLAASVLRFAQNIGLQLSASSSSKSGYFKSEVFSPLSVMSALALVMLGAKGRSHQELAQLFGRDFELDAKPGKLHEQLGLLLNDLQQQDARYISRLRGEDSWRSTEPLYTFSHRRKNQNRQMEQIIKVANAVFAQTGYNLNPDYRQVIKSIYHSELSLLDFQRNPTQSRAAINDWVNQNTYGKIPNMIDNQLQRNTKMLIASALYFKAFWDNEFFPASTKPDDFYPDGETAEPITVKMMATGGVFPYYDAPEYGCRILGMPYQGNMSTMYVIMPHESTRAKLSQLQRTLDEKKIENMIAKMTRRSALVAFPKMHIKRSINMKELLQRMGVRNIFTAGVSDLSLIGTDPHAPQLSVSKRNGALDASETAQDQNDGFIVSRSNFQDVATESLNALESQRYGAMSGSPESDLYVDDVVHKIDFDVNEHGTEAAAATVTTIRKTGPEVLFRVDGPFMLLIRHDPTKLILFYGIINEPPQA